LPFECKFCGGYFCLEHRLPEDHNCPDLPPRTSLGSWQTRKDIAYAHSKEEKDEFISVGDFHFVRKKKDEVLESKWESLFKSQKPIPWKSMKFSYPK